MVTSYGRGLVKNVCDVFVFLTPKNCYVLLMTAYLYCLLYVYLQSLNISNIASQVQQIENIQTMVLESINSMKDNLIFFP